MSHLFANLGNLAQIMTHLAMPSQEAPLTPPPTNTPTDYPDFAPRFELLGRVYRSVREMVGEGNSFFSTQGEVNLGRIAHYAQEMTSQRWRWDRMRSVDVKGDIVEDRIEWGITPSGKRALHNGHHRYIAAQIVGHTIPEDGFIRRDWKKEPKVYLWEGMSMMFFDPQGFYPVLTPP